MTTLSWFIYIVFMGERMYSFFGVTFFVVSIFVVLRALFIAGPGTDIHMTNTETGERTTMYEVYRICPTWALVLWSVLGLGLGVSSFIPDMQTALAIAAIEVGSDVLENEYVQDMIREYTPNE